MTGMTSIVNFVAIVLVLVALSTSFVAASGGADRGAMRQGRPMQAESGGSDAARLKASIHQRAAEDAQRRRGQ